MQDKRTEYRLPIAIPNGIILGIIGLLVMLTPLVEHVEDTKVAMDLISGGCMLAGGILSLVWGLRKRRSSATAPAGTDGLSPGP